MGHPEDTEDRQPTQATGWQETQVIGESMGCDLPRGGDAMRRLELNMHYEDFSTDDYINLRRHWWIMGINKGWNVLLGSYQTEQEAKREWESAGFDSPFEMYLLPTGDKVRSTAMLRHIRIKRTLH